MKKRRNNYILYAVAGVSILLAVFYGSFQPRNIESVTVVSGVGLEEGNDGNIRMIIQLITPQKSDSGGAMSSATVLSGEGKTVAEATEDVVTKTGSTVFWSHCAVILLREDIAEKRNVIELTDMFFRSMNFKDTASVLICSESPEDIFNSGTVFESISAFGIQKLLDDQNYDSNSVYTSLKDLTETYYYPSGATVAAGIRLEEIAPYEGKNSENAGKEGKEKKTVIDKCRIIKNGKLIGSLENEEFVGYKWLSGTMEAYILSLNTGELFEGDVAAGFFLFDAGSRAEASLKDGKPVLTLKVKTKAEILTLEKELKAKNISKQELNERYNSYKKLISGHITQTVEKCKADMISKNADYSGIKNIFYAEYGKKAESLISLSDAEFLSSVIIEVSSDVTVISGGLNKRFVVE